MVTKKLTTLLVAAGALALVLTGCTATQSDPQTSATQNAPATTAPAVPSDSPLAPGTIPPDADLAATPLPIALDAALAAVASVSPGLTVTTLGVEYDQFFGKWVWAATAQNGTQKYDITINAETGAVLESKLEKTDGASRAVDATTPMTPETAMAAAQTVLPGTVAGWSLEWQDEVLTYDVDIRTDASNGSVTVDAQTGNASIDD